LEALPMRRVSKAFYVGAWLGAIVGFCVLQSAHWLLWDVGHPLVRFAPLVMLLGLVPGILAVLVLCVLLYKMWDAIQDGDVRTTPPEAVGFMFIPLFNLYWVFQAFWGWTKDFNSFVEERAIRAPRMPKGLALTISIITLLSAALLIGHRALMGLLLVQVNVILLTILFAKACDGLNAIAQAGAAVPGEAPPEEPAQPPKLSGVAIASLLLGIYSILTLGILSIVGLILGIVALHRIGRSSGRVRGRGYAITGTALSLAGVFLIPLVLLPALVRVREAARGEVCQSNLKQIGIAMAVYANDHDDSFPPRLQDLYPRYITDKQLFYSPSDPARKLYIYVPGLSGSKPLIMLAFDHRGTHSGGRHILFSDVHIEWMYEDSFQKWWVEQRDELDLPSLRELGDRIEED